MCLCVAGERWNHAITEVTEASSLQSQFTFNPVFTVRAGGVYADFSISFFFFLNLVFF